MNLTFESRFDSAFQGQYYEQLEETGFGKSHLVWQKLSRVRTPGSHCGELCGTQNMRGTLRGLKQI